MKNPGERKPSGHPRAISNLECFRVNLRDRLCCAMCGRKPHSRDTYHKGFEYHHVVPVREGGAGRAENIVLLCKACHRAADLGGATPELPEIPGELTCSSCGLAVVPQMSNVNCGWYECGACGERTHLFDHFAYP